MKRFLTVIFLLLIVFSCTTTQKVTEKEKGLLTKSEKDLIGLKLPDAQMKVVKNDSQKGDLVLRKKSLKALMDSDGYDILEKKMMASLKREKGVGIAAPQVGVNRKVVIVQRLDKEAKPFEYYYNPEIIDKKGDLKEGWEGCLSVPAGYGKVDRWQDITVEYDVMEKGEITRKIEHIVGFTAVIFQHELDHLDGILFIDKKTKDSLVPKDEFREMRRKEKEENEKEPVEPKKIEKS